MEQFIDKNEIQDIIKYNWQMLLNKIEASDTHGFLRNVTGNWNNHLPLLLLGLSITEGPVMELGSGEGSTKYLRDYCAAADRPFQTFDNNKEWCEKTGAEYVEDWHPLIFGAEGAHRGLIFIDHAPGEVRAPHTIALKDAADMLVLHDTEEYGAGNYKWINVWPHFKYRLNYNKTGGGAGATAVSNKIDLNVFRGLSLGSFKFDDD